MLNGNDVFCSNEVIASSENVKFAMKKKFGEKVIFSFIISSKGMSKNLFMKNVLALDNTRKLNSLRIHILLFINEHHENGD